MITLWGWVFAVVYIAMFAGAGMRIIGHGILADEDSPYPFTPEEMERFDRRGHLARIGKAGPADR